MEQIKKPILDRENKTITYYIRYVNVGKKIVVTFKDLKLIPKTIFDTEQVLINCLRQRLIKHNYKDIIRGKELINNIEDYKIFKIIKKDKMIYIEEKLKGGGKK